MLTPYQWFRLLKIKLILIRYCLRPIVLGEQSTLLRLLCYLNPWSYSKSLSSRGVAIRLALEQLGPVFIKFGQMLSTRPDVIPADIVAELEKLQDRVPPFPGIMAKAIIESTYRCSVDQLFMIFDEQPFASASISQVHGATLADGAAVVVKIIRPGVQKIIRQDVAILYSVARMVEFFWSQGRRLRPIALVAEFEQTILDELDLRREAASASQLRRNFLNSSLLYVPKVYWDYVQNNVLVMERISGVRISDLATLHHYKTNMQKLAEDGVEIFFTQVFRDNFFHADMHPGNLFVDITDPNNPKYLGVDFGIMGSLSPSDQRYLAENLLAFFDRDYRRVVMLHIESGWVPPNTRIDQMEAAIRTVCEPIFEKPLSEISFGKLLLQLFMTAERFNMEIQPQLMLLQKTLLNIEGLGRQLYPELDLWDTAKPFMQRWVKQQYGPKNLAHLALQDWPQVSEKLVRAPKMMLSLLDQAQQYWQQKQESYNQHKQDKRQYRRKQKQGILLGISMVLLVIVLLSRLSLGLQLTTTMTISMLLFAAICYVGAWIFKVDDL